MLTRCSVLRVGRLTPLTSPSARVTARHAARRHATIRRYSSSTSTQPAGSGAAVDTTSPLVGLCDELNKLAPRFDIDADDVQILRGPAEFYEVLQRKILKARKRIYLSTLYIGKTEHELIGTLRTALTRNASLELYVLTDALRGTRETPEPTTASLLAPLIEEFGSERVQIRMYHTPNLTGLRKRWIPKRINEGWGLQHMKLYGVDDEIILSGANLSKDYFTNRLDRYHLFSSQSLAQYFHRIHMAVSSISFDVQPSKDTAGYILQWPTDARVASPLNDPTGYRRYAAQLLTSITKPTSPPPSTATRLEKTSSSTTSIYPVFQLTPLYASSPSDTSTELPILTLLLKTLAKTATHTTFTAGYFNPTPSLTQLLLSAYEQRKAATPASSTAPTSSTTVIAASAWANGFYGSKGVSGLLPSAYTLLCRRFLEEVKRRSIGDRVKLLEWRRGTVGEDGGWTYHAKGVWVTLLDQQQQDAGPSITVVGSSNYTQRSYTLDLEANALVVTNDRGLQKRLREEEEWLRADAKEVGLEEYMKTERRVGAHVRIAMWITKLVGGAL